MKQRNSFAENVIRKFVLACIANATYFANFGIKAGVKYHINKTVNDAVAQSLSSLV